MPTYKNRIVTTISNTPGSSGALTISTAQSGYRTFTAADDGKLFDVVIVDGTAWEVRSNCTYTNVGTSLSRGTLDDSSTGSAITLTSSAVVSVTMAASFVTQLNTLLQATLPGGRLTLTSGTPVTTSDVTGATTIYYTPYQHNVITLWDGTEWSPVIFAETSLALGTLTSGRPYDVFGFLSGGALSLELLAWTNDTTRATAVTLQDGRYCKSGDKTRLLLGTFYTTSTTTTEDSAVNRYLNNAYNRVERNLFTCPGYVNDNAVTSYTTTSTTWVAANGGTNAQVNYVLSLPAAVELAATVVADSAGAAPAAGIGDNSTTSAYSEAPQSSGRLIATFPAIVNKPVGRYFGCLLVRSPGGSTVTVYADDARSGSTADPYLTFLSGDIDG